MEVIIIKLPDGVKPTYGFVTSNRDYAKHLIDWIKDEEKDKGNNVVRHINSVNDIEYTLQNGTRLIWVRPNEYARGYRFAKVWIDFVTCSNEVLQNVILPKCIFADKEDIHIVQSSNTKEFSLFELIEHLTKFAHVYGDVKVMRHDSEFGNEDITEISELNGEITIGI